MKSSTYQTARHPSPIKHGRGFTLVEMLVVMVLLSIIMLGMVSALRSAGQSSERVDARLESQDAERVAERFVRNTLSRVSERPISGIGGALQSIPQGSAIQSSSGKPPILFAGAPNQISWIGILPARYGAGGRSFFHLSVEPWGNGSGALVIRYAPWTDQPGFPDWGSANSQVLLTDVMGFAVQYENDRPENMDASTEWVGAWDHSDYLPSRVTVGVLRGVQAPLEWVVPLRPLIAGRPGGMLSDEDVIGGTPQ